MMQIVKASLITFVLATALGQLYVARASADSVWVEMPVCQFEDGNTDGKTCLWVDPDTGKGFVSLSENYWGTEGI